MISRTLVFAVAVAAASTGCAGGGQKASTSLHQVGGQAWIAGHLPNGFVIIGADEGAQGRAVGYAPPAQQDCEIRIIASSPEASQPNTGSNPRSVRVRGHDATLVTLSDTGQAYGVSVAWNERSDLRLVVEGSNGPSEQETLAVAQDVRSISDADWHRLVVELSPDTHIGKVDPNATPVDVVHGTIGGHDYVLTALVPRSFPLGPDDRRVDCFHLSYRSQTTKDECPSHAIWARVGGQLFVFGDVDVTTARLRIAGIYGSNFASFSIDTTATKSGPPTRFYVAPLPEGACSVSVLGPGGSRGGRDTGPLQEAAADYTRCTGLKPGQLPAPPTTAH